jgi:Holliday junction resolvase
MRTGQARKRDALEPYVVEALEEIGVAVWRISGPGVPDLLAYSRGVWLPLEVKSGKAGTLTPAQVASQQRAPYPVVRSVAEALALFGVTTRV